MRRVFGIIPERYENIKLIWSRNYDQGTINMTPEDISTELLLQLSGTMSGVNYFSRPLDS
jgi:hypothetical protein